MFGTPGTELALFPQLSCTLLESGLLSGGLLVAVTGVQIYLCSTLSFFSPSLTQGKPLIIECWENFLCSVLGTHPKLKQLDLGSSILKEWAMKILCLKQRNPTCKVQTVTFKNVEVASSLRYLWMTLISNQTLKYLHRGNTLMKEDIKLACEALRHPNCSLETLRLDSCELTPDCYMMLSKLLL